MVYICICNLGVTRQHHIYIIIPDGYEEQSFVGTLTFIVMLAFSIVGGLMRITSVALLRRTQNDPTQ